MAGEAMAEGVRGGAGETIGMLELKTANKYSLLFAGYSFLTGQDREEEPAPKPTEAWPHCHLYQELKNTSSKTGTLVHVIV